MNKKDYNKFISDYVPRPYVFTNALISFLGGGVIGMISEFMLEFYQMSFYLSRKDSGVLVILSLIVVAAFLTSIGVFDVLITKFKSALIIPITGFSHSITSAALEYKNEGFVLGIGSNIFKLAGSVILYGTVSVYVFGLLRLILGVN